MTKFAQLAALVLLAAAATASDTVLDEQFCQAYYTLEPIADCPALRSKVRSELRGNGTPTLELGNPKTQPAMLFLHGWPDTSATWANYFAAFCGEDKDYFCVAPSWIDFHPDQALADPSELTLANQRARFLAVLQELGLTTNLTLVMFDFGATLGYGFLYEHPDLVSRVVSMDIPMSLEPPTVPYDGAMEDYPEGYYVTNNLQAFLTDNDTLMDANVREVLTQANVPPCLDCRMAPNATVGVGARTGWPYYDLIVRTEPQVWTDAFDDVPAESSWEFDVAPSFPSPIPLLYLYSGTFVNDDWNNWIDGRGDNISEHVLVPDSDHWFPVWKGKETIQIMKEWLDRFDEADGPPPSSPGDITTTTTSSGNQKYGLDSSAPIGLLAGICLFPFLLSFL